MKSAAKNKTPPKARVLPVRLPRSATRPAARPAALNKPSGSSKSVSKAPALKPAAAPLAASARTPAARPAALGPVGKGAVRVAAHPTKALPTAKAAPKPPAAAPLISRPGAVRPGTTVKFGTSLVRPGASLGPASLAVVDDKGRASKKPKPPAKTMKVPAPVTDILVKRALPDVRRIASAALLSDSARGIAPPSPHAKTAKESERDDDPPVDASLIATSLAADAHPKIEDNYDYSVLQELHASSWCPTPTRMVNTGCGGGEAAVYFAKRGFSVVGIDHDRMAVGLARERAWLGGVEIDFMVGDLFETPNLLPAESFGLAIDRGAFYKLTDDRDRQRYLANIRRLLFQGGIAYLSAGFFPLPAGAERPRATKKPSPKVLLVREGGVVVNEVRQAGFDPIHRVLRPTVDSGEYGELFLYIRK